MKKILYLCFAVLVILYGVTGCNQLEEEQISESFEKTLSERETAEVELSEYKQSEKQGQYAFSLLEEPMQTLYLEILAILENREENVDVSTLSPEEIDIAFQCVMNDHPEIFYVQGYKYTKFTKNDKIKRLAVSGTYTMTAEQIEDYRIRIENYADACLAGIHDSMGEYEKVKYVYEYIVANTEYNLNSAENQNIASVFLFKESVCQGYAKAMQYLLNKLGIFSTLVTGTVESGEGHAWNLVQIDGSFYYVDVTWGDAFYEFDTSAEKTTEQEAAPTINYDYLCVTTEQILKTHKIDNVVPVPRCVSMEANYYVREGAYFTGFDETKIADLFAVSYERGIRYITLKSDSYQVFQEILDQLIEKQKVFEYMEGNTTSVAYTINEKQHTISFWLS